MKDFALRLIESKLSQTEKWNTLREYLQTIVLRELHAKHFFEGAAFVGGTALRVLHQLPRYSEDLDFTLHSTTLPDWVKLLESLKSGLTAQGYTIQLTYRDTPPLLSSSIKFVGLLSEAGLSPHAAQILSIKLELDTRPPEGAVLESKVVNLHFPLAFLTHDISSLFAGKIHAMLARGFTKGRDFFDLGFYLSKWRGLQPNMTFLQNALRQTGWEKPFPTESTWKSILTELVQNADWAHVNRDVKNFLERSEDRLIFTKENVLSLLRET